MSIRSDLGSITHVNTTRAISGTNAQTIYSFFPGVDTVTATVSWDDTALLASQGKQLMTATITPAATTNLLIVHANMVWADSAATTEAMFFLTAGPTGGASGAALMTVMGEAQTNEPNTTHLMWAGFPTAATQHIYAIRCIRGFAGTLTFNGASGLRKLGGISGSGMIITEVVQ